MVATPTTSPKIYTHGRTTGQHIQCGIKRQRRVRIAEGVVWTGHVKEHLGQEQRNEGEETGIHFASLPLIPVRESPSMGESVFVCVQVGGSAGRPMNGGM